LRITAGDWPRNASIGHARYQNGLLPSQVKELVMKAKVVEDADLVT
jgi:hypothetical protein